jgi:hypothetical protein
MSQGTGEALAILAAGILLAGWAFLRIRSDKSYISDPPTRVSRQDDPFSFGLSVVPLVLVAAVMIVASLVHLIGG